MLTDVRHAIWSELDQRRVAIDPFRRSLQRSWLSQADENINPSPAVIITPSPSPRRQRGNLSFVPNNDVRALMRSELLSLDGALKSAIDRAADKETRAPLVDARAEIRLILNPD
jgi:hypothetical protein